MIEGPDFEVRVDGWNPVGEALGDFRQRARDTVDRELQEYIAAVEASSEKQHWLASEARTTPQTYAWTVRSLVLGEPLAKIAQAEQLADKTVREAVNGLLKILGFEPRRGRGRPRGSKSADPTNS